MSGLRPLIAYLLRSALGDRLLAVLVLAILAGAALAAFVSSTALVERGELATVYAATAGRSPGAKASVHVSLSNGRHGAAQDAEPAAPSRGRRGSAPEAGTEEP